MISFSAMGTKITVSIIHPDAKHLLNQAKERLLDYEYRFSANRSDSQLMSINLSAGIQPQQVDMDLYQLIEIGKEYSLQPNTTLNIAIGPLVKLWRIGFKDVQLPSRAEIQSRLSLINPQLIQLNEAEHSIYLAKKGMEIDLGALAKGYFADRIKDFLQQAGVEHGIINLGGNVVLIGGHPQNNPDFWRVGIQDPEKSRDQLLGIVKSKNQSVVTSGIYERLFQVAGKTYHHIFDPNTGYPVENDIASVTIISKTSLMGEIYTSLYYQYDSRDLLQILEETPEIDAIIIDKAKQVYLTSGIHEDYIQLNS